MAAAPIQIVDKYDTPLRAGTKQEAWKDGLRHRVVRILVSDGQGRVLLQKRAAHLSLYPGHWDNAASGHVDAFEDYATAARRELAEELGLVGVTLRETDTYQSDETFEWRRLRRFNKVYRAVIDGSTAIVLQKAEVADAQWFTLDELRVLVDDQSVKLTKSLQYALKHYYL